MRPERFRFTENEPVGTVVGEFTATDPDAGAVLTYHLVSGVGDGNNSLFTLETNGTLRSAVTFDYESNASSYAIRVQVKDEHNATLEGNFTVLLLDVYESTPNNPPSGLSSTGTLSVYENQPAGTVVGEFNATDPDAGAVLTYHLVSGVGDGNNSLFTLETNGTLRSAVTFDYESNASSYAIRVQVKDEHNATSEGNFTVLLLDVYESTPNNPPSGLSSTGTLSVYENQPVGDRSWGIQCDRSGCRSGSDLSLGEWSRRRKQFPLYFGDQRHAPERGHFRLRIERFELCDPCTSQGRA